MVEEEKQQCAFKGKQGRQCTALAEVGGMFCFWHEPTAVKTGPDIKRRLEDWAKTGQPMEGFLLRHARLEGIRLSRQAYDFALDLSGADLYQANLRNAQMFDVDLTNANLMRADFTGANLSFASLKSTNLLGTSFKEANLDHVSWGDYVLQESLAQEHMSINESEKAIMLYDEAEQIYRNLRHELDYRGDHRQAGKFLMREKYTERMQKDFWSFANLLSMLNERICGYGEKPARVVTWSLSVVFVSAIWFFSFGMLEGDGRIVGYSSNHSAVQNLIDFGNAVYFSLVTFTTVGYGDLTPAMLSRPIAALEGFTGAFSMALFVVVFVKRMTR